MSAFLDYTLLQLEDFKLSVLNLIIFVLLFSTGKVIIRFTKRYFNEKQLTKKQFTIEGKEIALWKLTKQVIWLVLIYVGFLSLRINNTSEEVSSILNFEFFRVKTFHVAIYHFFVLIAVIILARISLSFIKVWLMRTVKKDKNIDQGTQYIYQQQQS